MFPRHSPVSCLALLLDAAEKSRAGILSSLLLEDHPLHSFILQSHPEARGFSPFLLQFQTQGPTSPAPAPPNVLCMEILSLMAIPIMVFIHQIPGQPPCMVSHSLYAWKPRPKTLMFTSQSSLNGGGENKNEFLFWDGGQKRATISTVVFHDFPSDCISGNFVGGKRQLPSKSLLP